MDQKAIALTVISAGVSLLAQHLRISPLEGEMRETEWEQAWGDVVIC